MYPFFFNLRIQETSSFGPLMILKSYRTSGAKFLETFNEFAVLRIPFLKWILPFQGRIFCILRRLFHFLQIGAVDRTKQFLQHDGVTPDKQGLYRNWVSTWLSQHELGSHSSNALVLGCYPTQIQMLKR